MFKKAGTEQGAPKWDRVDTIIGKATHINGTVDSAGVLRVDGKIEGELIHRGDLIVGENGVIDASVHVRHVTIAGQVHGNIDAEGKVEIVATGQVVGDVKSAGLIIADGAVFIGRSEMTQRSGSATEGSTGPLNEGTGSEVTTRR